MVKLTLFDDTDIVINADLIEFVEKTPDTVISLTTGKKIVVKESVEQVIDGIVCYKQRVSSGPGRLDNVINVRGGISPAGEGL